jgi:RNA polymerase sigma-70 factor (ECF subfamily)
VSSRRPVPDDDVVSAAKAGNPEAWRALYTTIDGRLVGWLRSQQTGDAAFDADDIASETWTTAARRIADFSGTVDGFAGWIFVIARNLMTNTRRRAARRATSPTDVEPATSAISHGSDGLAGVESADWIRRTLSHLSPRERDVVAAIDIAGLDVAGASRLLSMSQTAVRSAHYRARRRLAAVLAEEARSRRPRAAEPPRWPRAVARLTASDD